MIFIKISDDFSDAPGARYYSDGEKSGQEFLDLILRPKFEEAEEADVKLVVDLDDVWGYASSFISGSFGELSTTFGRDKVLNRIEIRTTKDILKDKVISEIINPKKKV